MFGSLVLNVNVHVASVSGVFLAFTLLYHKYNDCHDTEEDHGANEADDAVPEVVRVILDTYLCINPRCIVRPCRYVHIEGFTKAVVRKNVASLVTRLFFRNVRVKTNVDGELGLEETREAPTCR